MNQRAYFAILVGAAIAGLSGILIKHLTIPATSIAFLRMAIPALILAGWMQTKNITFFRGHYRRMLTASALNAIRMYLFLVAYIYTSISNAVIMLFTWPLFVNLMSFFWLKEYISRRQVLLLVLAFSGIILIYSKEKISFDNNDFVGMTAMLCSAALYAISYIIYKQEIQNYHRNEIIFYQNLLGAFVFLPFFFLNPWPELLDWGLSFTYATLMGIMIFNLFFFGLKYLQASTASALGYFEIVSAILTGVLFMDEQLSWQVIAGGLMILTSITLIRRA